MALDMNDGEWDFQLEQFTWRRFEIDNNDIDIVDGDDTDTQNQESTTFTKNRISRKQNPQKNNTQNTQTYIFLSSFRRILLVAWSYKLGNSKTFQLTNQCWIYPTLAYIGGKHIHRWASKSLNAP